MANLYNTRNVVNWSFFMLNNVARKIKVLFKLIFKWQQVSFSAHGFSSFSGVHFIQTGGKLNIYQLKVFCNGSIQFDEKFVSDTSSMRHTA